MALQIDFCFDRLSDPELGYPNLARPDLQPDEFDTTWPRVLPVRLFSYFPEAGLRHRTWLVTQAPPGSWYPIGLAWHDFDCDYFALLPKLTHDRVASGDIRLLFYYHEGDNPERIKRRMDQLCERHAFPSSAYLVISANSASQALANMMYFPDHELFFRYVNRFQQVHKSTSDARSKDFTALNRTHKWWRATCMADLYRDGLLDNSLWSYNPHIDIGDVPQNNPISIDQIPGLRRHLDCFLSNGPYACDHLDQSMQNDHSSVNQALYDNSYCHIVFETHFDADQSGGTFLTEKTYKCIKYGQPFIIVGPPGSISSLRDRGYKVFDHAINHDYDNLHDNTQRWIAVKKTLAALKTDLGNQWFLSCLPDIKWNQQHYMNAHGELLDQLVKRLL